MRNFFFMQRNQLWCKAQDRLRLDAFLLVRRGSSSLSFSLLIFFTLIYISQWHLFCFILFVLPLKILHWDAEDSRGEGEEGFGVVVPEAIRIRHRPAAVEEWTWPSKLFDKRTSLRALMVFHRERENSPENTNNQLTWRAVTSPEFRRGGEGRCTLIFPPFIPLPTSEEFWLMRAVDSGTWHWKSKVIRVLLFSLECHRGY